MKYSLSLILILCLFNKCFSQKYDRLDTNNPTKKELSDPFKKKALVEISSEKLNNNENSKKRLIELMSETVSDNFTDPIIKEQKINAIVAEFISLLGESDGDLKKKLVQLKSGFVKCMGCGGKGKGPKEIICKNCKNWNLEYRSKGRCEVCKDNRTIIIPNGNICLLCKGNKKYKLETKNKNEWILSTMKNDNYLNTGFY